CSHMLMALRQDREALIQCEQVLALQPDNLLALHNRGKALLNLGRSEEGLASYGMALAISPKSVDVLWSRGVALLSLGQAESSIADFEALLRAAPDTPYASGLLLLAQRYCCRWLSFDHDFASLEENLKKGKRVVAPHMFVAVA